MWFESQNCAMMGLQATTGCVGSKRKLEAATAPVGESSPAKSGRWEADDCIKRLQAVAVPADAWTAPTPSSLAQTLLNADDDFDDDDFDDDLSDEERCIRPKPARFTHHQPYANRYQPSNGGTEYWQYYQPSAAMQAAQPAQPAPQQQTIRCEENGKSYLELGAAPPQRTRCCDGRSRWCHVPCYRQRRMAVLNLSMCKLARYRQCSDPSLRRSVLICNTLRRLEREMESEPPEPSFPSLPEITSPSRVNPVVESGSYEQSLREMTCSSGRATPFPAAAPDTDSGLGDDEISRPINWGSVLSLSSQTDLESLNNNELYAELGLTSAGDHEWKLDGTTASTSSRTENEWDGFMQHVLVGT